MAAVRQFSISACFLLAGCDAWPTVIDNRTPTEMHFQYHQKGYDDWSVTFDLPPGKATRLARAHYAEDIIGIRVREGARLYDLPTTEIDRLHRACSRTWLDHLTTAGDCWLTYYGGGRFNFDNKPTPGIVEVDASGNAIPAVE